MKIIQIIICWLVLVLCVNQLYGQNTPLPHTTYFEEGKATISLQQLDSIKQWAAMVLRNPDAKIQVLSYATDAMPEDSNYGLAGRRALLLQQCLERAGVPLESMYVARQVEQAGGYPCGSCGAMKVTSKENFLYRNIEQDLIKEYLSSYSAAPKVEHWIDSRKDTLLALPTGQYLQIPAGAFVNSDPKQAIRLTFQSLKGTKELLLHGLSTRTNQQNSLTLQQTWSVTAAQNEGALSLYPEKKITILGEATEKGLPYHATTNQVWQFGDSSLKQGYFAKVLTGDCDQKGASTNTNIGLPNFAVPPTKPNYIRFDSVAHYQDTKLAEIQKKLDYWEALKVDDKGRPKSLDAAQRSNEYTLLAKKNQLLVTREQLIIKANNANEAMEQTYYQALAAYNKERNTQQHQYLSSLKGNQRLNQQTQNDCAKTKATLEELKQQYTNSSFAQINHLLTQQSTAKPYYWLPSQELGWNSLAVPSTTIGQELVPYRVKLPVSAYKVLTFLVYDQQVIIGEILDETDVVFWEVPNQKAAHILAITKQGEQFLTAWQPLKVGDDNLVLKFLPQSLEKILEELETKNN